MRDLDYKEDFIKDLKKIDNSSIPQIKKALQKLRGKPELGKPLRKELAGFFSEHVGAYRIIYQFDEKNVYLLKCRKRKEGY